MSGITVVFDLTAIRHDLGRCMRDRGWNVYDHLPDVFEAPAAVVALPESITYLRSHAGGVELAIPVEIYAARADAQDANWRLEQAVSQNVAGSLVDALQGATGDAWHSVTVTGAGEFGAVLVGQTPYVGALLRLTVTVK